MVKKVVFYSALLLFFFGMTLFFLPKERLFFLAEKELRTYGIVLQEGAVLPKAFGFELLNTAIYYNGVFVATIEKSDTAIVGFYNKLSMHNITPAPFLQEFIPADITFAQVRYKPLLQPLQLQFSLQGPFGTALGSVDIKQRELALTLRLNEKFKKKQTALLRQMKRMKNGEYSYATHF